MRFGSIAPTQAAPCFAGRYQGRANARLFRRNAQVSRRALLSGGRGRRFKSSHSDQSFQIFTGLDGQRAPEQLNRSDPFWTGASQPYQACDIGYPLQRALTESKGCWRRWLPFGTAHHSPGHLAVARRVMD